MSARTQSPDRRIELLTKNNFDTWSMQIEALLTKDELWAYVDGSNKISAAEDSEREAWLKQDKKTKASLILAISPPELYRVRGCETAQEVWFALQRSYAYDAVNPPEKKAPWMKKEESEKDNEICNRLLVREGSIIKVFCHHPVNKILMNKKLIGLEATLGAATDRAYKSMMLDDVVGRDQVRLVTYQESTGLILSSFEGREEESLNSVLGNKPSQLLLEIRNNDDVFESYPPDSLPKLVYVIDSTQNLVTRGPIVVRARLAQTVQEYKKQLVTELDIDSNDIFLIFQSQALSPRIMIADSHTLQEEGYASASKILVLSSLDSGKMFDLEYFLDIHSLVDRLLLINVSLPDLPDLPDLSDSPDSNEVANTDQEVSNESADEDSPQIYSPERDRDSVEIISKITRDEQQPDKLLRVLYDKKMGPSTLKKLLQAYVGVPTEQFMLWVIQSDPYKSSIGSDWTWDPNWYNLVDGNTIAVKLKSGLEQNQEEIESGHKHANSGPFHSQESIVKFPRLNVDKNLMSMRF
ncbi:ubiquitin carboxyl-terminal hydrolase 47-like [Venturia canescens]|uniref:ubiquitin carboxyl-terminal hydrolase 47-like n=1 Tax=Venturia canescens TaxID=32260 RepID=UPI001C9C9A1B|nr:ubiquitin carboxyl-terminal hydrolase 47-like [Venturia canescens]